MKKRKPIRRSRARVARGKAFKYEKLTRTFNEIYAQLKIDGQPVPVLIMGSGFTRGSRVVVDGEPVPTSYFVPFTEPQQEALREMGAYGIGMNFTPNSHVVYDYPAPTYGSIRPKKT